MKKIVMGAAIALSLAVPAASFAQRAPNAQIVVVDTERVYRECTACRAAQTQLQSLGTQLQQRAQQLGQPIETELQSIQQAATAARNTTGAARTTAEQQLQQRAQRLEAQRTTAQQELARMEQNIRSIQAHVSQQVSSRLMPIITQAMNNRGATVVIDKGGALASAPAIDITNDVLTALNQQLPSVSVTPLPQQPQQRQPQGR